MNKLAGQERLLAETVARLIARATEMGLPDAPHQLGASPQALRVLARAYVELRGQVRALHDLVDLTDPNDPIGTALTKVGLKRRPSEPAQPAPRLVRTSAQIAALGSDEMLAIYCRVMGDISATFANHETFVVRVWDGMDGCWTDCTGEVGRDEALRVWAERTDGGTRQVSYAEIDYYRIFPGGTRMHRDGAEGELYR